MIVRVRVNSLERWHRDVTAMRGENGYLVLELAAHPSRVWYWLGAGKTSVLAGATDGEITKALQDEALEGFEQLARKIHGELHGRP